MSDELEIIASQDGPAEIAAGIQSDANIEAKVEQPAEIHVEVMPAGPQGPRGPQGEQGIQGETGDDGAAATIAVGTVATLPAGSSATVTNSGTSSAAVFDFGIPKGDKGDAGDTGPSGADGADGVSPDVTVTDITGGHRVIITDADHPSGQTFNVMDGEDGQNGQGVPTGGTTGQVLTKKSGTDYDTEWASTIIPYGKLDLTSTATDMTATVPGITELKSGVCVWLTNGVVTSTTNYTIDINGLGAKPVYSSQAAATRTTSLFNVNYTALLIYNEDRVEDGCWDYVYGYDSNTNTIGYQIRTNGVTMPMDSITYRYRLLFQKPDGKKFVPANNSTSTNATASRTVCQTPIDPFGLIVYYGTTASVAAGAKPSSSYLWQQYDGISLGYSFNRTGAALTLTTSEPIYLKCAPQSDGSAKMDSTTPFVQALPSTADGKIYIFLGIAASATTFTLTLEHPVYYHDGSRIRIWTGKAIPSPSSATPQPLGTAAAGSSTDFSRADHVHEKPTYTAADVGAVAVAQGAGHAGEFLVVGSDGNVKTVTMSAWNGGNY